MGNPTGNRVVTCADVKACLEGDYSSWVLKWNLTGLTWTQWADTRLISYNATEDKVFLYSLYSVVQRLQIRKLSDGTSIDSIAINEYADGLNPAKNFSVLMTYFAYATGGVLHIYKNGVDVQQIDLTAAPLSWDSGDILTISMSFDGKYIYVMGYDDRCALFEGS